MEERIVDPNGSERRGFIFVGIFLMVLIAIQCLVVPHPVVIIVEVCGASVVLMFCYISRPYVVLDTKGVSVRFFLRKQFSFWHEVEHVGIRNTKATNVSNEYRFPVVIILPNKSKRQPSSPLWRDIFRAVVVPGQPEIRNFVQTYYGPLDFNDIEKLTDWEKKYYHLD